jgi:hypothetical protein
VALKRVRLDDDDEVIFVVSYNTLIWGQKKDIARRQNTYYFVPLFLGRSVFRPSRNLSPEGA